MLNPDSLKKTARGLLPSFSEIFTDARYARQLYSDRQRGTAHDTKPGEVFIWTERAVEFKLPQSHMGTSILVATPTPAFWQHFDSKECGSIRMIPWAGDGAFLVVASRQDYIGEQWHAFVTMEGASIPVSEAAELPAKWPPLQCAHGRGFHCPQCWGAK